MSSCFAIQKSNRSSGKNPYLSNFFHILALIVVTVLIVVLPVGAMDVRNDMASAVSAAGLSLNIGDTVIPHFTLVTPNAGWSERRYHTSVVLPNGDILVMGGTAEDYRQLSDVWISSDGGETWTPQTAHAPWSERKWFSSAALPNGDVLVMGGLTETGSVTNYLNDVWLSQDSGKTWTQQTAHAGWSGRRDHTSVVLPNGDVLVQGGIDRGDPLLNDVWLSKDSGKTWTLQTAHAPWVGRWDYTSAVLPNGDVLVLGGRANGGIVLGLGQTDTEENLGTSYVNDVWISKDSGKTWTLQTDHAEWSERQGHKSVVLPNGDVLMLGGWSIGRDIPNEVWLSKDSGKMWTLQTRSAAWSDRQGHTCVALPDGSIVLMGGVAGGKYTNDVWRMSFGDPTEQNAVVVSRPFTQPISQAEIVSWRDSLINTYRLNHHSTGAFVWGDPSVGACDGSTTPCVTKDPIVGYGMKIDETSGVINQFVGRASSTNDVGHIHTLLSEWDKGDDSFDHYLDRTYPYESPYDVIRKGTRVLTASYQDNSRIAWKTTIVDSTYPQGMQIGIYTLKMLAPGQNWNLYALETEIMPVPGAQAFKSGYITENAQVRHVWNGDYQKYSHMLASPLEDTTMYTPVHGRLVPMQDMEYKYISLNSQARTHYHYGFSPGLPREPGAWPNTIAWSLNYNAYDPADNRGDFNPISVVGVKSPEKLTSSMNLMTIYLSTAFRNIAVPNALQSNGPADMLGIGIVEGGASP